MVEKSDKVLVNFPFQEEEWCFALKFWLWVDGKASVQHMNENLSGQARIYIYI